MRRITSVFRRNDKSKNDPPPPPTSKQSGLSSSAHQHPPSLRPGVLPRQPSKKGRFLSSITVSTASPPLPPLDHNHSSASSAGSASFSLQTPDDDGGSHLGAAVLPPPTQQPPRKDSSWFSWKGKPSPQIALSTQSYSPSPSPQWPDSAATVGASPLPARTANAAAVDSDDDDDETSDGESSSSSGAPLNSSSQPLRPDRALAPTEYFVALSLNRLIPSLSQPPLLHVPDAPLFPRSMCSPSALSSTPSLAVSMHRRRVLARLQRRDMSPADRHMMLTFGPRPESKLNACMRPQQPDESARYDLKRVQPHSRGLRRWTARPYFEERVSVWTPDPTSGAVSASAVKGCGFGVLALDVSEALELLAGHDDPSEEPRQQQQQQQPRPRTTFEQELLLPPSAHSSGSVSDRSSWSDKPPSPLRHQSDVSAMTAPISASLSIPVLPSLPPIQSARAPRSISASVLPSSSSTSTVMTASTSSTIMPSASQEPAAAAAPRREVRFTPNVTTESKVPKDYVLRIQRNKEEKARFLREEQQRREHETERLKHEQERQRWEEEKRKWESERRVIEEQRKRKSYADELAAARARRDQQHALPSRASRDSRESYARPQYDLRQGSETSVAGNTGSRTREGSSGSSRQGSSSGYASTPRTPNTSRPPSTYSATSTDESRAREAHASRRASNISVASSYRSQASAMGYGWPSSPTMPMLPPMSPVSPMAMSYAMPLVPMIPQFAAMPMPMDMPLLPPNAPFMMHGNGSRSRTSSSSRQSASSRNASPARAPGSPAHNNRSSERVGSTAPSSRGRAHQRAGSGDMKRGPPPSASATSQRDRAASAGRGTSGSSSTYLNGAAGLGMCPPTLVTQNSWAAPSPPQQQHMSRAAPMPRRSTAFA